MTDMRQTVFIIDDHPLFRKGLIQLLRIVPGFDLVGEAVHGRAGVQQVLPLRPDLVVFDLNMKEMSGLEVLRQLKLHHLDTRVVMVTVSDAAEDLIAALRAGADGYLLKDSSGDEIVTAILDVRNGRSHLDPQIAGKISPL